MSSGNRNIDGVSRHYQAVGAPQRGAVRRRNGLRFRLPGNDAPALLYIAFKYFNATLFGNRKSNVPIRVNTEVITEGRNCTWYRGAFMEFIGYVDYTGGTTAEFDDLANMMAYLPDGGTGKSSSPEQIATWKHQLYGASQVMDDDDYQRVCGARRLPDYSDQLKTGVERARNKANVNKRIIELGEELSDVQHDVGELQGRATIAGSLEKVFANLDGMAVEAFDQQRSRSAADKAARAEQHEGLAAGLFALGARILGRVKGEYQETLRGDPTRDARSERAAAVQIGRVSLNQDVLHRSAAISTARSPRAAALPAPSERPLMIEAPRVNDRPARSRIEIERPVVVVRRRKS
jgi:hypothetical protein